MQWVDGNGWILWLALALTFGAIEAATVDLMFLMLAGGALAAALMNLLGLGLVTQVVVAVVVAIALLGVVRPMVKRRLGTVPRAALGVDAHLGRTAIVVQTVTEHDGRVKLGGEIWTARVAQDRPPAEVGQEVQVVAVNGATVIVVPVNDG